MAAALALWHNAHRERQVAELVAEHSCTMLDVVREIGVSANDVEHIVARLRKNGLPVATIDVGDDEALYRILTTPPAVCAPLRAAGRSSGAATRPTPASCTAVAS